MWARADVHALLAGKMWPVAQSEPLTRLQVGVRTMSATPLRGLMYLTDVLESPSTVMAPRSG